MHLLSISVTYLVYPQQYSLTECHIRVTLPSTLITCAVSRLPTSASTLGKKRQPRYWHLFLNLLRTVVWKELKNHLCPQQLMRVLMAAPVDLPIAISVAVCMLCVIQNHLLGVSVWSRSSSSHSSSPFNVHLSLLCTAFTPSYPALTPSTQLTQVLPKPLSVVYLLVCWVLRIKYGLTGLFVESVGVCVCVRVCARVC